MQLLAAFGQMLLATLAGIVGARLAPDESLATLPVAAAIVGVALAAFPTAVLIRAFGRRKVFIGGLIIASAGAVLAATAVTRESFGLFTMGSLLLGMNMGVVAQYRFAAADLLPEEYISRAVSALMVGLLAAALLWPWVVVQLGGLLAAEFASSFAAAPGFFLLAAIILLFLPVNQQADDQAEVSQNLNLLSELKRREVQLAVAAGTIGFGVMSVVMTAAPVSMHVIDAHSVEATANAIRAHIVAMYAPSLASGWLIARLGLQRMLWAGLTAMACCIVVANWSQSVSAYIAAMILLGIGWNFLYVGGTTLLASVYRGRQATRMQGINDMIMFGTTAVCSLSAGALLFGLGWAGMNTTTCLLLILILIALLRGRAAVPVHLR